MPKKYWFKRKTYGYGWTPCTWQGWLVIALGFTVFIPLVTRAPNLPLPLFMFLVGLWAATLVLISYLKGPAPRWQWGNSNTGEEGSNLNKE